jgi:acylphosphatase
VLACGPVEAVDSLCRWLRQGPPAARVDDLVVEPADCPGGAPASFTTA